MRARSLSWCLLLVACGELTPAPERARPSLELRAPRDTNEVPLGGALQVELRAVAPAGGSLARADLLLSGEIALAESVPLSGPEQELALTLTPRRALYLGPDRLPLELTVWVTSEGGPGASESERARVSLFAVDRSAPSLRVDASPGLTPPPGFDRAYPAGAAFRVALHAEDPIGGVVRLGVQAPRALGGERATTFTATSGATALFELQGPWHLDQELVFFAEDAAFARNRAEARVRVRLGDGGVDRLSPALAFVAEPQAECGLPFPVLASAVDEASGVERLTLDGAGLSELRLGPDPADPLRLAVSATAAAPGEVLLGQELTFALTAADLAENRAPPTAVRVPVADTLPPRLDALLSPDASVAPGQPFGLTVLGEELCSVVAEARAVLTDSAGDRFNARLPLDEAALARRLELPVPEGPCTAGPIRVELSLVDRGGRASPPLALELAARDVLPPRLSSTLLPGQTATAGASLSGAFFALDLEGPVASATLTVSAVDLALPAPLLVQTARGNGRGCTRDPLAVPFGVTLPRGARFTAPVGRLTFELRARDASGQEGVLQQALVVEDALPPTVRFLAPQDGAVVDPGEQRALLFELEDLGHEVDQVSFTVFGPGALDLAGTRTTTLSVRTASASLAIGLWVDAGAPPGATLRVVARAVDTAPAANSARAELLLATCGPPALTGVSPPLVPAGGGTELLLQGAGFLPGRTRFLLSPPPLELAEVDVLSSRTARARLPAGPHPPGPRALLGRVQCATPAAEAQLPAALRVVAPPRVGFVAPDPLATAAAGQPQLLQLAAEGDGLALALLQLEAAGSPPIERASPGPRALLLATVTPTTGASAVRARGLAADVLGQIASTTTAVPLDVWQPWALELRPARTVAARGELLGYAVLARGSDGRSHDVTELVTLTSEPPGALTPAQPGVLAVIASGAATLTASLGTLAAQAELVAHAQALVFAHPPLLLSALPGSAGATPALWLLDQGVASEVSGQVTLSVDSSSTAQLSGGALYGQATGRTILRAALSNPPLQVAQAVHVATSLLVPAGEERALPSGQLFAGGELAGEVLAWGAGGAGWSLAVVPGAVLEISGALQRRGALGLGGPGAPGGALALVAPQAILRLWGVIVASGGPGASGGDGGQVTLQAAELEGAGAIDVAGGAAAAVGGRGGDGGQIELQVPAPSPWVRLGLGPGAGGPGGTEGSPGLLR